MAESPAIIALAERLKETFESSERDGDGWVALAKAVEQRLAQMRHELAKATRGVEMERSGRIRWEMKARGLMGKQET